MPEPAAGEVRVKVAAAGLNFKEVNLRKGVYKKELPFIPGDEFAGVIDAVGEGVSEYQPGERVATPLGSGAYAEYALAPISNLVPLPDQITFESAAALMLQGMTAHYLALSAFPIQKGNRVLIHAAAGGVGQLLVQIAKKMGALVIATVSTEEKGRIARDCGADEVIIYSRQDFEAEVLKITNGEKVDAVYDGVGKATFLKSLNCVKPRGVMILFGHASGPVEPIDPELLSQKGSLYFTRPTIKSYIQTREEILWRANDLFTWFSSQELKVQIDRSFPLRDARQAHDYMEGRETKGKVLLIP